MSRNSQRFSTAAASFADAVADIPADRWQSPGLGVWTVRELVAHGLRGATTVEEYLAQQADVATLAGPGEYYAAALALPGIHDAVAQRARDDASRLGDDPVAAVRSTVDRVVALVAATPLDTVIGVRGGSISLDDYLITRTLELVLHTDDLCRALGLPPVATDDEIGAVLEVVLDLLDRDRSLAVLRALTGRGDLPADISAFG